MPEALHEFFTYIPVPETLKEHIVDSELKPIERIANLSKINIFVGENNSGKSYLLRETIKSSPEPIYISQDCTNSLKKFFGEIINKIENDSLKCIKKVHRDFSKSDLKNLSLRTENGKIFHLQFLYLFLTFPERDFNVKRLYKTFEDNIKLIDPKTNAGLYGVIKEDRSEMSIELCEIVLNHIKSIKQFIENYIFKNSKEKIDIIYIHNHRSLFYNTFTEQSLLDDIKKNYRFSTEVSNDNQTKNKVNIETGLNIHNIMRNLLLTDANTRAKHKRFEDFLSKEFFFDKQVIITPAKKENDQLNNNGEVRIKIGDEDDRSIYELGTGLQMMIILTLPLFNYDSGIVFIEEPELFIHPGMQKQLMEIYSRDEFNNFMFFIATHSNHIIDTKLKNDKISIFSIKKLVTNDQNNNSVDTRFVLNNIAFGDRSPYQLLGVTNSSVALANCSIWVEGVSDMIYISKYIEEVKKQDEYLKYKDLKEDIHYCFVFSGGNNIYNFNFDESLEVCSTNGNGTPTDPVARFICGKSFIIVDDDFGKNTELKESIEKKIGPKRLYILPVPEIENTLSLSEIKSTVKSYPTRKYENFELSESEEILSKTIKEIRLGTFIDEHLLKDNNNKKHFSNKYGCKDSASKGFTIQNKHEFAKNAYQHITYETMSNEAKELAGRILDFIYECNNFEA